MGLILGNLFFYILFIQTKTVKIYFKKLLKLLLFEPLDSLFKQPRAVKLCIIRSGLLSAFGTTFIEMIIQVSLDFPARESLYLHKVYTYPSIAQK